MIVFRASLFGLELAVGAGHLKALAAMRKAIKCRYTGSV